MPSSSNQQHELLSTDVQDIISYRPHWMIRYGNLVFLAVLLLATLGSWFIRYPDVISASGRLVAIDGPKTIVARVDGKLEKLLVQNESAVIKGQPLAYLQSTGSHTEVLQLYQWINTVEQQVANNELEQLPLLPVSVLMGELQPDFEQFKLQWQELQNLAGNGYYTKKKAALTYDLNLLAQQRSGLLKQNKLLDSDYVLQQKDYSAKAYLTDEKVIAALELNMEKGKLLQKQQGIEQMNSQLLGNVVNRHNKTKELLEIDKNMLDLQLKFQAALFVLKSKTQDWMNRYILIAAQSGKLYYNSFLQENQFITAGTELFFVQPPASSYYAEIKAGQAGIGKVAVDQKVLLYYDGYPSEEFGYLTGKLNYISNIPGRTDSFLLRVTLPDGLITNRGKQIYFRNNLHAKAEIITNNRRLTERFTGKLYELMKR